MLSSKKRRKMEEKLWDKILAKLPEESLAELDSLSEDDITEEKITEIVKKSGLDLDSIIAEVKAEKRV